MQDRQLPVKKLTLEEVQEQFTIWRETRKKKQRIPPRLWKAAVSLSSEHPLSIISNTLRINYTDLRRRVLIRNSTTAQAPDCTFIELDASKGTDPVSYTIELEDRFGSRMKINCSNGEQINPLELITVFSNR